jgi:phosphoribosylamine--glycine ligase
MNVLVVGSGGREHALVWKILKSPYVEDVFCAPGNGGIADMVDCVDIQATNIKALMNFVKKNNIELTVVGPELPLTLGIVDIFQKNGLLIFGPDKKAAQLEGSKVFAKEIMKKYNVPTADYRVFTNYKEAVQYVKECKIPIVLKADGLAAGKGVLVCTNRSEVYEGIDRIMKKKVFGDAGKRLIIEEFLTGEEASLLAITDGERVVTLPPAQDHKAIFEGDRGPNTGGMGAYAPTPIIDSKMIETVKQDIIFPVVNGMKNERIPYKGVLYVGLILTEEGHKVLEFNCRFGDPEIQAILPLIKTDIVDIMMTCAEGRLKEESLEIIDQYSVCVVIASGGYPGPYEKGKVLQGLKEVPKDLLVFHAGTQIKNKKIVTSGGRVLGVTGIDDSILFAVDKVYKGISKITFDGAYYRKDIGHRVLKGREN